MDTKIKKLRKNAKVLAEGYKAIKYDLSTNINSPFRYGNKDDDLIGKVFTVDGKIEECNWGLHFSKDPANVFNFYKPLGYNRYFKVEAYDECIDTEDGFKSVARTIKFVEEYDIMEFIELIKEYDRDIAVTDSSAVNNSRAVSYSNAVSFSYGIRNCEAISKCIFCANIDSLKFGLFNKKTSEKRIREIISKINSFNYTPKFDNFYQLKGNKEWYTIAFPELMRVDNKTAWSKIPKEMVTYLKSLPEYDEDVFNAVVGD